MLQIHCFYGKLHRLMYLPLAPLTAINIKQELSTMMLIISHKEVCTFSMEEGISICKLSFIQQK